MIGTDQTRLGRPDIRHFVPKPKRQPAVRFGHTATVSSQVSFARTGARFTTAFVGLIGYSLPLLIAAAAIRGTVGLAAFICGLAIGGVTAVRGWMIRIEASAGYLTIRNRWRTRVLSCADRLDVQSSSFTVLWTLLETVEFTGDNGISCRAQAALGIDNPSDPRIRALVERARPTG